MVNIRALTGHAGCVELVLGPSPRGEDEAPPHGFPSVPSNAEPHVPGGTRLGGERGQQAKSMDAVCGSHTQN